MIVTLAIGWAIGIPFGVVIGWWTLTKLDENPPFDD